jgi:hypothetical protein
MKRMFVVVTPNCPHRLGINVGSKECTQCDDFRGGIVVNFVDCAHEQKKGAGEQQQSEQQGNKKGRPAKKANSKPVNKRKLKK